MHDLAQWLELADDHVRADLAAFAWDHGATPMVGERLASFARLLAFGHAPFDTDIDSDLDSDLPPLPDPRSAARAVFDSVAGFGPLQRHLDENSIEETWINERLTGWSTVN